MPEDWMSIEEYTRLLDDINTESDRAAAVLAAAMLDDALKYAILARATDRPAAEKLLRNSAPLGAFSARIDAALAFGLIEAGDAADLHIVRRIRNDFAHEMRRLTFQAQKIADLAANLRPKPGGLSRPRGRFFWAVLQLSGVLTAAAERRPSARNIEEGAP
jgi:hypothetical protein